MLKISTQASSFVINRSRCSARALRFLIKCAEGYTQGSGPLRVKFVFSLPHFNIHWTHRMLKGSLWHSRYQVHCCLFIFRKTCTKWTASILIVKCPIPLLVLHFTLTSHIWDAFNRVQMISQFPLPHYPHDLFIIGYMFRIQSPYSIPHLRRTRNSNNSHASYAIEFLVTTISMT